MFKKYSHLLVLALILILYAIIRIKPLQYHTVAYTYDQGRDFLKAAEMVMTKKPTFIGPTTGISGLYHGAWWYYVLAIPFILFHGAPMGFYWFNFLIHLASLIVLYFFVRKYFGSLPAMITGLLVATSPYFIYISLFVGNNMMVPPVLLGFLIVNFYLTETKKIKYPMLATFLAGLFLGLIGEFELSFGLFLIPTYLLGVVIFKTLRAHFLSLKRLAGFFTGLIIAFLPRLLFETKNHFLQTRTLLSFFFKPKLYNPKSYIDVLKDRVAMFRGYWEGVFPNTWLMILTSIVLVFLIVYIIKNKSKIHHHSLLFFSYLVAMLFLLSTFYKDNFWSNYYEGIPYIFLLMIVTILSVKTKLKVWVLTGQKFLLLILVVLAIWQSATSLLSKPKMMGLAVQQVVVSHILSYERNTSNYCVRIYTPPVIPYTYNYLFTYEKIKKGVAFPNGEWVNGTCWFIMEDDPFKFRLKDWKKVNEPADKAKIRSKTIKDVIINHYEVVK